VNKNTIQNSNDMLK